jgi:hypothetical protein
MAANGYRETTHSPFAYHTLSLLAWLFFHPLLGLSLKKVRVKVSFCVRVRVRVRVRDRVRVRVTVEERIRLSLRTLYSSVLGVTDHGCWDYC